MIFWVIFGPAALWCAWMFGGWYGTNRERERCINICARSFYEGSLSPTARRIYHSIDSGRADLIGEDEFFGPDLKEAAEARGTVK